MSRTALEPEALGPDGRLRPEHVESWRERGFALVDHLLPAETTREIAAQADRSFPAAGSEEAAQIRDFGSRGEMAFPSESDLVNDATLHPRLLSAIATLLECDVTELRLTQSDLWPKYGHEGGGGNADQRIHVDYPNHTLTHPPRWDRPEAVELIVYLSDVDDCEGGTAVVPREGPEDPAYPWPIVATPGVGDLRWINDREKAETYLQRHAPEAARFRAEHLYPRERGIRYRVGTVLLYRHDTWHRGTPLRPGARRIAWNMTFRRASSEWISVLQPGWAWAMYRRSRAMERLVARSSVDQRCVLGFPPPGHAYWSEETLEAVTARYGPLGFDPVPYRRPGSQDASLASEGRS